MEFGLIVILKEKQSSSEESRHRSDSTEKCIRKKRVRVRVREREGET
jgi:hypothetical protein